VQQAGTTRGARIGISSRHTHRSRCRDGHARRLQFPGHGRRGRAAEGPPRRTGSKSCIGTIPATREDPDARERGTVSVAMRQSSRGDDDQPCSRNGRATEAPRASTEWMPCIGTTTRRGSNTVGLAMRESEQRFAGAQAARSRYSDSSNSAASRPVDARRQSAPFVENQRSQSAQAEHRPAASRLTRSPCSPRHRRCSAASCSRSRTMRILSTPPRTQP
jgi:hypothetical protein